MVKWVLARIQKPDLQDAGSDDAEPEDPQMMGPDCPCQQQRLLERIHKPGFHGSRSDDDGEP